MKSFLEFLNEAKEKTVVDRLESFIGKRLKDGRNEIKGFPVDLDGDSSGPDGVEGEVVDKAAAKGLAKVLKSAGFKVTITDGTGILIQ